jgi:hypothetical protein
VVREGGRRHVPRRDAPGAQDGIIPDPHLEAIGVPRIHFGLSFTLVWEE